MKEQIEAGIQELRKGEMELMGKSEKLRYWTIALVVMFALVLVFTFRQIYLIEIGDGRFNPYTFLSWIPFVLVMSLPFVLLWWMLQRWSYETKTLAYGFQRKRIVEERIFHFFDSDEKFFKELWKIYVVHWMEKSPLEVMLSIGGKGKSMGGGNSPTAALLESAGSVADRTSKDGS